MYDIMIWTGAGLSLLGLAGILWCIFRVARAKRARLADEELRAAIAAAMPINMAALFVSVIGLMLVVIGVMLG